MELQEIIGGFWETQVHNYSQIICAVILGNSIFTMEWQEDMTSLFPWQTFLKQFYQIKYVILNMRWLIVTALTQQYSSSNNIGSSAHWSSYSLCVYYVPGVPYMNETWPSLEEVGLMSRWLPWPSQQAVLSPLSFCLHFNSAHTLLGSFVSFCLP